METVIKKEEKAIEKLIGYRALLITQMNHWILFTPLVTLIGFLGYGQPDMGMFAILSVFPLVLFFIRRSTDKFVLFVFSHLAAGFLMYAILLLLGDTKAAEERVWASSITVMYILYILGYIFYSLMLRLRTKDRLDRCISPVVALLISAVMLFAQKTRGQEGLEGYYIFAVILYLCLYFFNHYLEQFQHFMKSNDSSSGHMPQKQILHSGVRMVWGFCASAALVFVLIGGADWLSGLFTPIKEALLRFLKWLLSLFIAGGEEQVEELAGEGAVFDRGGFGQIEEAEPFWLWQVLEKIIVVAVTCLMAAVILFGVICLIRFLRERFGTRLKRSGEGFKEEIDVREKVKIVRKSPGERNPLFFLNPRERIRRLYKKRVLEGKNHIIGEGEVRLLNRFTAKECGKRLRAEEFAQIYEKARYSEEVCSLEDVKKAKSKEGTL